MRLTTDIWPWIVFWMATWVAALLIHWWWEMRKTIVIRRKGRWWE